MQKLNRDLNTKGYTIEFKDDQYTIDGIQATPEEIFKKINNRPYWANRDYKPEAYRGLIVKSTSVVKLIKFDDSYHNILKQCINDNKLLYYVRVISKNDDIYAVTDALLDFDSLPIHETWQKGISWPNKEYRVPSIAYELDRTKPINKYVGCFIGSEMKCPNCGKTVASMSGLTLHTKTCKAKPMTSDGIIYTCKICNKKTISKFGLTNHIKSAHPGVV